MFEKDDNTYNALRDKSVSIWLNEMGQHKDIAVRGGISVTQAYIADLKKKIINLEHKDALKNEYLRKLKLKNESIRALTESPS